jgi:hypothetical protein
MTIPPEIVQQILREQEERKRTQQNAVRNILLALLGFLFVQYVVPWGVECWQMANEKQRQLEEVQRQLDELRARTQSQGPQEKEEEDEGDEGKKESKKPSPPPPPSLPKPKPRPTENKAAEAVKAESTSPDAVTGLRRRAAPTSSSSSNSAAAAAAAASAAAQANPWSGLGRAPDPSLLEARRIRLQQDDDYASLQASQEAAAAGQRRVAAEARAREEREQRECDEFKVEFLRRCEAAAEAAAGAGGGEGEKDGGSIRLSLRFLGGRVDCSFSPSTTAGALLDYVESHALFLSAATADFEGGEVTKDELLGLGQGQGQGQGQGAGEVVVAARKTSSAATSAGVGVTPLKTAIATPAPAPSPPSSSSASSADKSKARGRVLQLAALEAAALVVHPKQELSRSCPRPSLSLPLSHLLRGATSAVVQVLARPREEGEEVDI